MVEVIANPLFSEILERGRESPFLFARDFLNVDCHPGQKAWLMRADLDPDTQKYVVRKPGAKECVLACSNRWGKLLDINTRLIGANRDGQPLTMGTVKIGDIVYGLDGQQYHVTWISPIQISNKSYAVVFSDGSQVMADAEHLWSVETTAGRLAARRKGTKPALQTLTTQELTQHLYSNNAGAANYSIPVCGPVEYPEQDLPLDPYMLGVWLGDGSSSAGIYTKPDPEIAEELRKRGFTIQAKEHETRCTVWRVEGLAKTLRGMGLLHNKHVPPQYLVGSVQQRLDLVRGLMDTDGYAESGGRCEFTSTRLPIAEAAQELLESLGQVVTLQTGGRATLNGVDYGPKYRIKWSPTLEVFYLPRKLAKQRESLGHVSERRCRRYITAIEPIEPRAMRCIEVDSTDHLYLVGRYIATHNTYVSAIKHLWMAFYQIRPEEYRIDPVSGLIRDYKTVNVAMSLDQAMLSFNYAYSLAMNPKSLLRKYVIDHKSTPFPVMVLGNTKGAQEDQWRSEIWARSTAKGARYLLGHNFNFINWDEAAFDPAIETGVLDEVIRMRLTDQAGTLDFTSSPNGFNTFQRMWERGQIPTEGKYYSYSGHIWQNTILGKAAFDQVKDQMTRMHPDWVEQNIWGRFAKMDNVFPSDAVMACYRDQDYGSEPYYIPAGYMPKERPNDGGPMYELVRTKNVRYVMGVDLARKLDYTAIVVLALPVHEGDPLRVAYFKMLNKMKWEAIKSKIAQIAQEYGNCKVIVDSTAMGGDVVLESLKDDFNLDVEGRVFSRPIKSNLILQLQTAIQSREVVFPYNQTLCNQLIYYRLDDKNLATDAVMGLALAVESAKVTMGEEAFERISTPDLLPVVLRRNHETGEHFSLFDSDDEPDSFDMPIL